ncbi:hypothetical protein Syun_001100 [Stephania yunnanensis]|uniref:Uncharacterized protein n=1 Tax=Stephania yunnanensis TaxID=152371 RepID=A0AAP0LG00_9MAGN
MVLLYLPLHRNPWGRKDHTLNQKGEEETAICLWSLQTFACLFYCSDAVSSYACERSFSCFRLKSKFPLFLLLLQVYGNFSCLV